MDTALRKVGVVMTVGGAALFPLGFTLVQSPADAALLDFSFTTQQGGTGSFTLDTSVTNTSPQLIPSVFPNAISNFTFSGTNPAASNGDLVVSPNGFPISSGIGFRIDSAAYGGPFRGAEGNGPVSQVQLSFSSPNETSFLPSDPKQYVPVPSPIGSIRFSTGGGNIETINSVTISSEAVPEPVPEPLTFLGSGMALGFSILRQRKSSQKGVAG